MSDEPSRYAITATGPASTTVHSQIVTMMLAAHARCGARTSLGTSASPSSSSSPSSPLLLLRLSPSLVHRHAGVWSAFLRVLWCDFIVPSQRRFVVDLDLEHDTLRHVAVQLCVAPSMRALTRPAAAAGGQWPGTWMDAHRTAVHYGSSGDDDDADLGNGYGTYRHSNHVGFFGSAHDGRYDCNSKWVVTVWSADYGGSPSRFTIAKAPDLDAHKFDANCVVESPFLCCVKYVSFCMRCDPDKAVVIATKPDQPERLLAWVVDVAMSFESGNLVIVCETSCRVTGDVRQISVGQVLSLTQVTGANCFLLKWSHYGQSSNLCMIRDDSGTRSQFAIDTKVNNASVSQLSVSRFCVCTKVALSGFAEIWDCGNDFRESGAPWLVKVMRFSELGGAVNDVGTVEANSGFLFVRFSDRFKVIEAATAETNLVQRRLLTTCKFSFFGGSDDFPESSVWFIHPMDTLDTPPLQRSQNVAWARDQFVALCAGGIVGRCASTSPLRVLSPDLLCHEIGRNWAMGAARNAVVSVDNKSQTDHSKPRRMWWFVSVSHTLGVVAIDAETRPGCDPRAIIGWVDRTHMVVHAPSYPFIVDLDTLWVVAHLTPLRRDDPMDDSDGCAYGAGVRIVNTAVVSVLKGAEDVLWFVDLEKTHQQGVFVITEELHNTECGGIYWSAEHGFIAAIEDRGKGYQIIALATRQVLRHCTGTPIKVDDGHFRLSDSDERRLQVFSLTDCGSPCCEFDTSRCVATVVSNGLMLRHIDESLVPLANDAHPQPIVKKVALKTDEHIELADAVTGCLLWRQPLPPVDTPFHHRITFRPF
ncbi:hypothetical protein Pelo_8400 [Pelomyxa schiedti]|nr:hypothetical protein Pelo_8400 [Pelomyxa schiedti]